ncbi:MAG: 2'-5' RNA ligase family protein [Anaerolineae bacterium]|nr:2'-5' RNA ligase family protein [Anaerolineae bacterium]
MPSGIVSLLNGEHCRQVEALWAELERTFGVCAIYRSPFPHLSYQVAERYDTPALEAALESLTARQPPFEVLTTGLGVFTGAKAVLYVPVVRSPALDALHRAVWEAATDAVSNAWTYYEPEWWMPHITLGHDDIDDHLPEIVDLLRRRTFDWRIRVDNIAFVCSEPDEAYQVCRLDFGG